MSGETTGSDFSEEGKTPQLPSDELGKLAYNGASDSSGSATSAGHEGNEPGAAELPEEGWGDNSSDDTPRVSRYGTEHVWPAAKKGGEPSQETPENEGGERE